MIVNPSERGQRGLDDQEDRDTATHGARLGITQFGHVELHPGLGPLNRNAYPGSFEQRTAPRQGSSTARAPIRAKPPIVSVSGDF